MPVRDDSAVADPAESGGFQQGFDTQRPPVIHWDSAQFLEQRSELARDGIRMAETVRFEIQWRAVIPPRRLFP